MVINTENKTKKYGWLAVRFLLGLTVLIFVGYRIVEMIRSEEWKLGFSSFVSVVPIVCAGILVFVNWGMEALKWKQLMRSVHQMRFSDALKGVLSGLSTGILTPNRVGNFIGRVALLPKELRVRGTLRTLLGNAAQFIISLIFGLIGFLMIEWEWLPFSPVWLVLPVVFVAGVSLWLYANPRLMNRWPVNRVFKSADLMELQTLNENEPLLKWEILGLSTLRYLVFVSQFVLVLLAFGAPWSLGIVAGVMTIYLLMTVIPSLFFGKLFLREAAALIILPIFGMTDAVIVICGFLMWFLNIAIPSLWGAVIFFRKK